MATKQETPPANIGKTVVFHERNLINFGIIQKESWYCKKHDSLKQYSFKITSADGGQLYLYIYSIFLEFYVLENLTKISIKTQKKKLSE